MTNIIEIAVGDYLYVLFPNDTRDRRVKVTSIRDKILRGDIYNRSKKKYTEKVIDLPWITGVKLVKRVLKNVDTTVILCEV